MSWPAQNASPAPVSTSTSVSESPANSSSASSMSRWSCGLMALRLSGRFMISQVMPSCFSIRTVSYFFVVIVDSRGWLNITLAFLHLTRFLRRTGLHFAGKRYRSRPLEGRRSRAANEQVEDRGDHRHQHGPYQPERRKLGALAVGSKIEQGHCHGLRAWP